MWTVEKSLDSSTHLIVTQSRSVHESLNIHRGLSSLSFLRRETSDPFVGVKRMTENKTLLGHGEDVSEGRAGRAAVVVLGDLGRSPRMQYHARSLAQQCRLEVDVVAYGGTDPHKSISEHPSIHLHRLSQWPVFPRPPPEILHLLLKPLFQFFVLLWVLLFEIPSPDFFIVQNPPSVPALIAVSWVSWFRGSAFIVDWHNFGYTLLALSVKRKSLFVLVYRWLEKRYGRMAHDSLCVTRAMQSELSQNWGIHSSVLYDRPPEFFHSASMEEKHQLFSKLNVQNLFMTQVGSTLSMKKNRPALIVSSTSWTPDEDFQILLDAATTYDDHRDFSVPHGCDEENSMLYPRLLVVITGKGGDREKYEEKISRLRLDSVEFRTMWLSPEDYPLLLGSADLGVCLHKSSSGFDLPMKVVDMFGCGLPVCAFSFSCINELVNVGKNGLLFSSSSELADQLMMLFKRFPDDCELLMKLRKGAAQLGSSGGWADQWEERAKPLVQKFIKRKLY